MEYKDGDLLICLSSDYPSLFPSNVLHRVTRRGDSKLTVTDVNNLYYDINFLKERANCKFIIATELIKALE